jgi:hypothetical protein
LSSDGPQHGDCAIDRDRILARQALAQQIIFGAHGGEFGTQAGKLLRHFGLRLPDRQDNAAPHVFKFFDSVLQVFDRVFVAYQTLDEMFGKFASSLSDLAHQWDIG